MWVADKLGYMGNTEYIRAYQGSELVWEGKPTPIADYFYVLSLQNGSTISLTSWWDEEGESENPSILEYSFDGENWNTFNLNTPPITINRMKLLYIRGKCNWTRYDLRFNITGKTEIGGSIMYIYNYENPQVRNFVWGGVFRNTFNGCTGLYDASKLTFPAINATAVLYDSMFKNCTNLVHGPLKIDATTFASGATESYAHMFEGCSSLLNAPELPATTLGVGCYSYMFKDCSSLVDAPVLTATILPEQCYQYMFYGCSSLMSIRCLAETISNRNSITNWVTGVNTHDGLFISGMGNINWATTGSYRIPTYWDYDSLKRLSEPLKIEFDGTGDTLRLRTVDNSKFPTWYSFDNEYWSRLGNEPIQITSNTGTTVYLRGKNLDSTQITYSLPIATTHMGGRNFVVEGNKVFNVSGSLMYLNDYEDLGKDPTPNAFAQLFYNCSKLAKSSLVYPKRISYGCFYEMYYGCKSLHFAPTDVSGWNSDFSDIKDYIIKLKPWCFAGMFANTYNSSSTTFSKMIQTNVNATLAEYCFAGMYQYSGVTSYNRGYNYDLINYLPYTTLAPYCYANMFKQTNLVYSPNLPATILAEGCYYGMFVLSLSFGSQDETQRQNDIVLTAPILVKKCYASMFEGCSSLDNIKCLAADISAEDCTRYWVYNVATNGKFVKLYETTWPYGSNGIPSKVVSGQTVSWDVYDS